MNEKTQGFVIINIGHPATGRKQFHPSTFRINRKECVDDFLKGTSEPWKIWYRKWNFRCVKAESIVSTK